MRCMQRPCLIWNIGRYFKEFVKTTSKTKSHLLEGFWPSSNLKVNHLQFSLPIPPILVNQEDPIIPLYCGIKNMKPSLSTTTYTPFRNIHEKDFILAHPFDPKVYLVWMFSRMGMIIIIEWCMFNGGRLTRKERATI